MTATTRVPKRTLAAVITSQIRERIVNGVYPPGTQMNEAELAAHFATSRGPVREGMQRLVQEGLLVSTPRRGIFVPILTAEDLEDLYLARSAIERAAMLRIVDRGPSAGLLAALEQALGEMGQSLDRLDWTRVAAADMRFHELIVDGAGSPQLTRMYHSLTGQTRLGLNMLTDTYQGRTDLLEEHQELAELIASANRPVLLATLDKHFGDALTTLAATSPKLEQRT